VSGTHTHTQTAHAHTHRLHTHTHTCIFERLLGASCLGKDEDNEVDNEEHGMACKHHACMTQKEKGRERERERVTDREREREKERDRERERHVTFRQASRQHLSP